MLNLRSGWFSPYFVSFIGLNLRFKSVVQFKLIFMYGTRKGLGCFVANCFSTICLKDYPFSDLSLHLCQKSTDHICIGLFLDSVSFHWSTCLYPKPVPQCFDYCRFIVSLEIRWSKLSNFILFEICFSYSRSFEFPYAF